MTRSYRHQHYYREKTEEKSACLHLSPQHNTRPLALCSLSPNALLFVYLICLLHSSLPVLYSPANYPLLVNSIVIAHMHGQTFDLTAAIRQHRCVLCMLCSQSLLIPSKLQLLLHSPLYPSLLSSQHTVALSLAASLLRRLVIAGNLISRKSIPNNEKATRSSVGYPLVTNGYLINCPQVHTTRYVSVHPKVHSRTAASHFDLFLINFQ